MARGRLGTFEFHGSSWKGDPRWAAASKWTAYAPRIVISLFVLSIIQIILGAVWVVQLNADMTMYVVNGCMVAPQLTITQSQNLPDSHLAWSCLL